MQRFTRGILAALWTAVASVAAAAPGGTKAPLPVAYPLDSSPLYGYIDSPPADSTITVAASGVLAVSGWTASDAGIASVEILVDGNAASQAEYGISRPDVAFAIPAVADSYYSGFVGHVDMTAYLPGLHQISVAVTDGSGAVGVLGPRTVEADQASLNLGPFGHLDMPLDQSTFLPVCPGAGKFSTSCPSSTCSAASLNSVAGWALDTGARNDLGQTGYVELLIDGVLIANTRHDCVLTAAGAMENCYGVTRPDVEARYSGFVNSDHAGWIFNFFAVDDGSGHLSIQIPVSGGGAVEVTRIVPGKHTIAIEAGDDASTIVPIAAQSANFATCADTPIDFPPFGNIDSPSPFAFASGQFQTFGWAFDANGVSSLDMDVDGTVIANVTSTPDANGDFYGVARPDVEAADPRVTTLYSGWQYLLDTTPLTNGPHDFNVYVIDAAGNRALLGRQHFIVHN